MIALNNYQNLIKNILLETKRSACISKYICNLKFLQVKIKNNGFYKASILALLVLAYPKFMSKGKKIIPEKCCQLCLHICYIYILLFVPLTSISSKQHYEHDLMYLISLVENFKIYSLPGENTLGIVINITLAHIFIRQ